jgi:phage minor tail protein G
MTLKTKESKRNPGMMLSELNGLQRLEYLEYIAELEDELEEKQKEASPSRVTAILVSINIKAAARMIALSLSNLEEYKNVNVEDIQTKVLKEYGLDDINFNSFQIRELSNMIAKSPVNNDSEQEEAKEPVTAEKQ